MKHRASKPPSAPSAALVTGLFFVSGAAGLTYEVVWVRLLGRVFGSTTTAVSTVLAAFMAGLALGSWLWGRRIDRTGRPLATFALLEAGVAVSALLFPLALGVLDHLYPAAYRAGLSSYVALAFLRACGAFLLLLVPTTFMGGTLPVLGKAVAFRRDRLGARIGALYAVNTFGAVTGTFLAGFVLLGMLGLAHTTMLAASAGILVALAGLTLSRRAGEWDRGAAADAPVTGPAGTKEAAAGAAPGDPAHVRASPRERAVAGGVFLAYGISGAAALALEVVWTRYLAMVLGTTTYAFSGMLCVFLLGLAAGSAVCARFADRWRRPVAALGWIQVATAAAVLVTLSLFRFFPELFLTLFHKWGPDWNHVVGIQLLLAFCAMILPTLGFGAVFPVVARIVTRELPRVGRRVGAAYALNTLGAIAGSLAGGLLLLPTLGIRGTSLAASFAALATGLLLVTVLEPRGGRRERAVLAPAALAAVLLFAFAAPRWDPKILTQGVYMYPYNFDDVEALHRSAREAELLFYEEGREATVSVERHRGVLALRINGKVDASSGEDMPTQILSAHIPLALRPEARSLLVIGLGSGVTVGAAEQHPALTRIRCIEIAPEVVRAAREFHEVNENALDDPRLEMVQADARQVLLLDEETFDVIVSEPSNTWISGMGDLFTEQFFGMLRSRLATGGVLCQFMHFYKLGTKDLDAVLRTFHAVFPHVLLWSTSPGDLLLMGSDQPFTLDTRSMLATLRPAPVVANLARAGFTDPVDVFATFLTETRGVEKLTSSGSAVVTDDNLRLEFSTPRAMYLDTAGEHLPKLQAVRRSWLEVADDTATLDPELRQHIADAAEGRRLLVQSILTQREGREDEAFAMAQRAYQLSPNDPRVSGLFSSACASLGSERLYGGSDPSAALPFLQAASATGAGSIRLQAMKDLGYAYFQMGAVDSARALWETVANEDPRDTGVRIGLGMASARLGDFKRAGQWLESVLRIEPDHAEATLRLGEVYLQLGDAGKARREFERVLKLDENGPYAGRAREGLRVLATHPLSG